ncbi:MAG: sigma-70 family RNA polymerase sigma factor [Planctomycetota bacterium]
MDEEREDYDQLHRLHAPRLALYAMQWVACRADAEDVVQDTFVRFWSRQSAVRYPLPYLYQSVRNAALNWQRGSRRRFEAETQPRELRLFEDDADALEDAEFRGSVEDALRGLPDEQREIVTLRIWGDLTFREMAETLGIPESTAKSRYRISLEALRAQQELRRRSGVEAEE